MTIAACYLSVDGVVFRADSTTTIFVQGLGPNPPGGEHHYNYAQKIFQIGNESTLGMTMWGLGNLNNTGHRTLIAQFADELAKQPAQPLNEVANRWNEFFWKAYAAELAQILQRVQELLSKKPRTDEEERELAYYFSTLSGGFCLGGNLLHDRRPGAFEILYDPGQTGPKPVQELKIGSTKFWGCPNIMHRLLYGVDFQILQAIENSGKWTGTADELIALILPHCLGQPLHLPIREAIDWVHASIYTTIKTMKFSHLAPVCGGPVEVGGDYDRPPISVGTTQENGRCHRPGRIFGCLNKPTRKSRRNGKDSSRKPNCPNGFKRCTGTIGKPGDTGRKICAVYSVTPTREWKLVPILP